VKIFRSTVDLGQLAKAIEQIRAFNRSSPSKEALLFLYGDLAKSISIQCNSDTIPESDRANLKDSLREIRDMEAQIEKIGTKSRELDIATLNENLAARMDMTLAILSRLEQSQMNVRP
jgi:uncharacterized membrane protein